MKVSLVRRPPAAKQVEHFQHTSRTWVRDEIKASFNITRTLSVFSLFVRYMWTHKFYYGRLEGLNTGGSVTFGIVTNSVTSTLSISSRGVGF